MDRRHSPDPGPLSLRVPGGRRQVAGRSRGSRRARRRVRRAELRRDCGGLLTLLLAATLAALQAAQGPDPRLERLDSISRPIVTALVDSARAADLVEFRRAVERDIALGAPPASATAAAAAFAAAAVQVNAGAKQQRPGRP